MNKQTTSKGNLLLKANQKTPKGSHSRRTLSQNPSLNRNRRNRREQDTKIEEEQKQPERKRILVDRSVINIHTLSNPDSKDLKNLVETEIKSPVVKRRQTIQNVTSLFGQPKKIEQEDWEERQKNLKELEEQK